MTEEGKVPQAQDIYDAFASEVIGTGVAVTTKEKPSDTPAPTEKPKEQDQSPKPAEKEPEPKGKSDDELPALYRPDKYKNRAAEKEAFENQSKLLGKRDDDAKAHKALMERLGDPEQAATAIRELAERANVKLETQVAEKAETPVKVGDVDLSTLDDDEVVTGKELKSIVSALGLELKEGQAKLSNVAEPILRERRMAEIESKGGLYSLVRDESITSIRDQLHQDEAAGKIKRDEILQLAATAMALQDGKLFEAFEGLFGEQYRASLTKKKQLPESGIQTVVTKEPAPKSEEEQTHDVYGKVLNVVDGR